MKNYKNNTSLHLYKQGFTLVELMIAMSILGILTSIAYPSYVKQVQKSKRTAAKVELMRIAQLQESFYVQNLSYATALKGAASLGGLGFSDVIVTTEGGDYFITLTSTNSGGGICTGTTITPCISYTLIALPYPNSPQAQDDACIGFSLTNTGAKGAVSKTHQGYGDATIRDVCW